jgi:homoserine kinase
MSKVEEVKVFSPATVANVSCAFDVLGFAIDGIGDIIYAKKTKQLGVSISNITSSHGSLPIEPDKNTASVAVLSLLEYVKPDFGIELKIEKKMPIGSGLGSSAASAAGGVFAANQLLDSPLSRVDLVAHAMCGEKVASGSAHADNVAPALLGGFALIRQSSPLDIVSVPFPSDLVVSVVCPLIEVRTEDARKVLKKSIPLSLAVEQFGNIAGLVTGLCKSDFGLIARSLKDVIVEPERSILIPGFSKVKSAALENGALGCGISGSGPSLFAICTDIQTASKVSEAMSSKFKDQGIECISLTSSVNTKGCEVLSS